MDVGVWTLIGAVSCPSLALEQPLAPQVWTLANLLLLSDLSDGHGLAASSRRLGSEPMAEVAPSRSKEALLYGGKMRRLAFEMEGMEGWPGAEI